MPAVRTPELPALWQRPITRPGNLRLPDTFTFLNRPLRLGEVGWDCPSVSRLWRYHLHYFDWLMDDRIPPGEQRKLVDCWIAGNAPPSSRRIGTGWEPYPLSLRIVNWIKWDLEMRRHGASGLPDGATLSLATQARQLAARLEYHLLGNHLWANAKALVFAGVYFNGDEADRWVAKGLQLVERELAEQVLPDGGHFELSPMYHAIFLEDLLDLLNLYAVFPGRFRAEVARRITDKSVAMLWWLRKLTHPDGRPAQFNDCALDGAPHVNELAAFAGRLGLQTANHHTTQSALLTSSGYARLQEGSAVLLADVGRAGPDYMPGHAHADALSFELSLWGERVCVNGGTSTYDVSPERLRERGTAAHNTVTVDGRNSSDVWGSFRLGRRIVNVSAELREARDCSILEGSFMGFYHAGRWCRHHRTWKLTRQSLEICDEVSGLFRSCEAQFRLTPGWSATLTDRGCLIHSQDRVIELDTSSTIRIERGKWAPNFGVTVPVDVIWIALREGRGKAVLSWSG
ncbi:MAG: heparinase II/III family protein [Steroidobacteraceae bacterium]